MLHEFIGSFMAMEKESKHQPFIPGISYVDWVDETRIKRAQSDQDTSMVKNGII